MTEPFVKVFCSILDSSVWDLDSDTRIVWITLLAMADMHGRVHAAVPGIARRARVSVEKTRAALEEFQKPDPDSRSDEYEGRRIEKQERDWLILNYGEHRRRLQAEAEKARKRDWWRKNRGKQPKLDEKLDGTSDTSEPLAPSSETRHKQIERQIKSKSKKESKKKENDASLPVGFALFWEVWPKKVAKLAAIKAWRQLDRAGLLPPVEVLVAAIKRQSQGRQWRDGVIPNPASWLRGQRWNDEVDLPPSASRGPSPGRETGADRQYRENRDLLTRLAKEQNENGPNPASNDATKRRVSG